MSVDEGLYAKLHVPAGQEAAVRLLLFRPVFVAFDDSGCIVWLPLSHRTGLPSCGAPAGQLA